jgi:antitoxin ParD1/3/4
LVLLHDIYVDKVFKPKFMSEIIHTSLRFTDEENKIETLKLAINEGLDSGIVTNFDPQKHLEELTAGKKSDN